MGEPSRQMPDGQGGNTMAQRQVHEPRPQKPMHKATCHECRKTCEVPFAPSPERPTYCNDCFAKRKLAAKVRTVAQKQSHPQHRAGGAGDVQRRFDVLNSKLDHIIHILGDKKPTAQSVTVNAETPAPETPKKKVAKKTTTKKKAVSKNK